MARKKDTGTASPFRAGFDARLNNQSIASCPYQGDEAGEWRDGFAAASKHTEEKPREIGIVLPKAKPK